MGRQTINVNIFPKSGYLFKDATGVVHQADSWQGVMRKVAAYRHRLRIPLGNVAAEVMAQACSREPGICREESDEQRAAYRKVSLKGQVLKFLAQCREVKDKGGLTYSNPSDAAARANVCAGCPFNTPLPGGCGSCKQARKEAQKYALGSSRGIDSRLNGCMVLGEDMAVAAWLERVTVDNPELPAHCWRKKTL